VSYTRFEFTAGGTVVGRWHDDGTVYGETLLAIGHARRLGEAADNRVGSPAGGGAGECRLNAPERLKEAITRAITAT